MNPGDAFRAGRVCSAIGTLLLTLGGVEGAAGQSVRGLLVERSRGEALPGASVSLLNGRGVAVDSTLSSRTGSFTLRAPQPGSYLLYFSQRGYASVPSDLLQLRAGASIEYRFEVPLISGVALQRMAEVIDVESRLQTDLAELCGERPRPEEAGILVGVVRRRRGGQPLSGAVVRVRAPPRGAQAAFEKATVSSANGVYVLCNVPAGTVTATTELIGFRSDVGPAEIKRGEIAWYDVYLAAH